MGLISIYNVRKNNNSFAFDIPTILDKKYVMPKSPENPTLEKAVVNFPNSVLILKSQARLNAKPAPAAIPFITATVGTVALYKILKFALTFEAFSFFW